MSQETVVQFFDAVFKDTSLQGKLNQSFAAIAPDALIQIAQENGYSFTTEELKAALQQAELSDEQLNAVAGGRPADFVREGGPPWVQNQSYGSATPDGAGEEAINSATESYPSAVETFRSLAD
ncbi:MAG: Nif11-like leader peptide family RiPP precursor [Nostoc sp.]|uniref:Nif11-like leader peptide family RiPP precursor n=1 Tax=Nostoc sp. TaxID=1180 RepID=UPI002FF75A1E